jgi:hypothetical protein
MKDGSEQRAIATRIAGRASEHQREALLLWMVRLLQIRDSSASAVQKAKQAVLLTSRSKVVWPMVKILGHEVKRVGWDERDSKSRFGIAGAGVGLALFGTQGAGIAALGGAIGVPLWIVLGAGAYFAPLLIDELRALVPKSRQPVFRDGRYEVLDVEAKRKE